jgi:hypothetical protein
VQPDGSQEGGGMSVGAKPLQEHDQVAKGDVLVGPVVASLPVTDDVLEGGDRLLGVAIAGMEGGQRDEVMPWV